jgi:hypothetical protein
MLSPDVDTPPLRRWPPNAFKFEPAHGYFVRLAARNSAHSVRVFADSVGLNGRDFDIRELLHFCRQFPITNMDELIASTPIIRGTTVKFNGQKVPRRMWSLRQPRVCGACIGEARYYRNWWDLVVIGRCPIHDRPLVEGAYSSKLAWWYPAVGITPEGYDLAISGGQSSEAIRESWDAYVLGRMGVLSSFPVPFLDESEIYEVISVVELLGKAAMLGFRTKAPGRLADIDRHQALSVGFNAFRGGEDGLVGLIEKYARSRPCQLDSKNGSAGLESFLGWLVKAEKGIPPSTARKKVSEAMRLVAGGHGIGYKRGRGSASTLVPNERPTALKPLARTLDISHRRLRVIAKRLGLLRRKTSRGVYHSFGSEDISLIKSTLADLVCLKDARRMTGLSSKKFKQFCKAKGLVAFAYAGTAQALFRRTEIEKCVSAPWDDGDGLVQSPSLYRLRRAPAIQGLGLSVAGSILGVRPTVVSSLIADGYLKPVALSQVGADKAGVEEKGFLAFSTRYARASLYFDGNAQRSSRCIDQLRKLGVERIPLSFTGTSFVERQEVRQLLGLTFDPDDPRSCPAVNFWNAMRVWLNQVQSPTLVYPDYGANAAKLWSADFRSRALAILEPTTSRVHFDFHCDSGSRRGRLFRDQFERIRHEWPNAQIFDGDDSYRAIDSRCGLTLTAKDNWPEFFRWIELRMKLLRSVFSRGADRRTAAITYMKAPRIEQAAI